MNSIELIDSLIAQVGNLSIGRQLKRDYKELEKFHDRAKMILSNILENDSPYISRLSSIPFIVKLDTVGYDTRSMSREELDDAWNQYWNMGITEAINLLELVKEEVILFRNQQVKNTLDNSKNIANTSRVFVVHGHNNEMKVSVARILERLGLTPVILHEQPNLGRTIIEKFEEYSDVGYAIVLLSPDDLGYSVSETSSKAKSRARQNVILELGYFLGKLGRNRVMVLYLQGKSFEMPSDFSGVLYVPFDNEGKWQFSLAKELKACEYEIDANLII